ncbi:hypothetical protein ABZ667_43460 [Streptomyces lavendulae]|uniref:hypothetical protein n=1 Tax=Streptomyces lavendulae TaxID=1914 RepID=UPI0033FC527D
MPQTRSAKLVGVKKNRPEKPKTFTPKLNIPLSPDNALPALGAASFKKGGGITPGRRVSELREIVWEGHWAPISNVCAENKYTICVRETGAASIQRISEGTKPKPHTILEKSIKDSSLKAKYGDPAAAIIPWLKEQDLYGFVGHWDEQGLAGVRIDNPPQDILDSGIVEIGKKGEQYVPVDLDSTDGGWALGQLKSNPRWKQYLYTGDYDLHEVYAARGGGTGQIPEASPEKIRLLNRLNAGISQFHASQGDDVIRQGRTRIHSGTLHMEKGSDYAMFQHGDQATYRMNQFLEAAASGSKAVPLVKAVATESDEPVAWCRFGQWYVTRNAAEHALLRRVWNLKTPHTWQIEGVARTATGGYRRASYI